MNEKVNGITIYYEKAGEGTPVIVLHGNGECGKDMYPIKDALKGSHTVYLPDSRCHGKSDDTETVSYDAMAEDVIAFIERQGLEKPALIGFSDGGIIGLTIAVKRPDILGKLVVCGANTNPKGLKAWYRFVIGFTCFFKKDKLLRLMLKEPDLSAEQLATITVPTLIVAGTRDLVRTDHTAELVSNIGGAKLISVTGNNYACLSDAGSMSRITEFLDEPV